MSVCQQVCPVGLHSKWLTRGSTDAASVRLGLAVRGPIHLLIVQMRSSTSPEIVKSKGSPYSIIERRVPELIPVLGSQPAGDVSHKPGGRLLLLSARPAVTPASLKRAAANFAAW